MQCFCFQVVQLEEMLHYTKDEDVEGDSLKTTLRYPLEGFEGAVNIEEEDANLNMRQIPWNYLGEWLLT